jgi:hypothetical protein
VSTVAEIIRAIDDLSVREQIELMQALPMHLKICLEDIGWTRASESSFAFWENPHDAVYDAL